MQIDPNAIYIIIAVFTSVFFVRLFPKQVKEHETITEGKYRAMVQRIDQLEVKVDHLQSENAQLRGHVAILEAQNKILNKDFSTPEIFTESPRTLIKKGKIKQALQKLLEEEKDDERAETFIILISQLARATRQYAQGLLKEEEHEKRLSSITSAALNLIGEN